MVEKNTQKPPEKLPKSKNPFLPDNKGKENQDVENKTADNSQLQDPKPAEKAPSASSESKKLGDAGQVKPLRPILPVASKKTTGQRGPDKQPRKPRGQTAGASVTDEQLEAVKLAAKAEALAEARLEVAREMEAREAGAQITAMGIAGLFNLLCLFILPPELSPKEFARFEKLWMPIAIKHQDHWLASPWFAAGSGTLAILHPRISVITARRRKRNAEIAARRTSQ